MTAGGMSGGQGEQGGQGGQGGPPPWALAQQAALAGLLEDPRAGELARAAQAAGCSERDLAEAAVPYIAQGWPAAKMLLRTLLDAPWDAAGPTPQAYVAALDALNAPDPRAETPGGLLLRANLGGRPRGVTIGHNLVPRGHDTGAQLAPLRAALSPTQWDAVNHQLSMQNLLTRKFFRRLAQLPVVRDAVRGRPARVDPGSSTLYVDQQSTTRVGICVLVEDLPVAEA